MNRYCFILMVLINLILLLSCPNPTIEIPEDTSDYYSNTIGSLKYVPAGNFQRDFVYDNVSKITKPFRMNQYEITRGQFKALMGISNDPSNTSYSGGDNDPVQMVNFYHAIAFCNKLSILDGLTRVYDVPGFANDSDWSNLLFSNIPNTDSGLWGITVNWNANGYRLPTETEWMWAAMGAPSDGHGVNINRTGFLKDFSGSTGSNFVGDYVVYGFLIGPPNGTPTERSNPIGSKLPNELGIYDLSGNVAEWCWDVTASGSTMPVSGLSVDYRGPTTGTNRVFRGGGWYNSEDKIRIRTRQYDKPYDEWFFLGFRVVRY